MTVSPRSGLLTAIALLAMYSTATAASGGMIVFRDGRTITFTHFGTLDRVEDLVLEGKMGTQSVSYDVGIFQELVFVDRRAMYRGDPGGEILAVTRDGRRFTFTEARLRGRWSYVYLDEITRKREVGRDSPGRDIASITFGDSVGDIKMNPVTGEYYPAIYVYDPFSGDELVWATRE